jgi:hypothetical protein
MNTSTEDLLTEDLFGYKVQLLVQLVMVQANIFMKINLDGTEEIERTDNEKWRNLILE